MPKTNQIPADAETAVPVEIKADLRRFNKAEEQVTKAVSALAAITKITDADGLDVAMDTLSKAAKVDKVIEAKRVEMVKPYNDVVKKINTYAKELAGKLPPAITKAKEVVIAYNQQQQELLEKKRLEVRGAQLEALGFKINVPGTGYIYEDIVLACSVIKTCEDAQWLIAYNNNAQQVADRKAAALEALKKKSELNDSFGSAEDSAEIADKISELQAPVPVQPTHAAAFSTGTTTPVKGITKTWTYEILNEQVIPREYLVVDTAAITAAIRQGIREIPGVKIFQKEGLTIR